MAATSASDRPVLPWPYVAILIAEVLLLAPAAALYRPMPPLTYELGWAGVASMLVMQLYSLRRRIRALRNVGALRTWLDAHIFLGLQGFVLVAYHSVGISPNANLAALNFALVATVVVSGIVGRYLYAFIPRTRAGQRIAQAELHEMLGGEPLPRELQRECRGLVDLVRLRRARARLVRDLYRTGAPSAVIEGRRRAVALATQISALDVADRWFARWTLFHRPVAFLLLGITSLHVLAHYAYAA